MADLKGIYKKEEVIAFAEDLINAQDKFILLALFNGIMGDDMVELRELKVADIDFEKNIINVSGRVIEMDSYFANVAKEAIAQQVYQSRFSNCTSTKDDYLINTNSEFVIRVKPTKRNNMGASGISYEGLRTRVKTILDNVGAVYATPKTIVTSGVVSKLQDIQPLWTQEGVANELKRQGYKMSARRIYLILNRLADLEIREMVKDIFEN